MFNVILRTFGAFPIISNFLSRKRLVKSKDGWNLGLWDISNSHLGSLWPCRAQDHFEIIRWLLVKQKQTVIWDSGRVVTAPIWATLGLLVFKVILRSLCARFNIVCNSKTAGSRAKEWNQRFGDTDTYMGYLCDLVLKGYWYTLHWSTRNVCNSKETSRTAKWTGNFWM